MPLHQIGSRSCIAIAHRGANPLRHAPAAFHRCRERDKKLDRKGNRVDVANHFGDVAVRKSIEVDLALLDELDVLIKQLEAHLVREVKVHDPRSWYRLRSVPGIGQVLGLVMLYEIHEIERFPSAQDFCSYARLVKCAKQSAGKHYGYSGKKICCSGRFDSNSQTDRLTLNRSLVQSRIAPNGNIARSAWNGHRRDTKIGAGAPKKIRFAP